jgi:2-phosphoglycolate phosphatase, prokaryotic
VSLRIVFDLDGTLIDSAPDLCAIANTLLAARALEPISLVQAREFIGNGASVFVEKLRKSRDIPDTDHDALLCSYLTLYAALDLTLTAPYPGLVEALSTLQAQGYAMGICTNKPLKAAHAVLDHFELGGFFDAVIGGDSLSVHKPDPTPLHAAFEALGAGPRLYVGDSEVDAETAARAHVPFLLFTEGYRKSPISELNFQGNFSHFKALPELISSIRTRAVWH